MDTQTWQTIRVGFNGRIRHSQHDESNQNLNREKNVIASLSGGGNMLEISK
jgi:hypothetical protein